MDPQQQALKDAVVGAQQTGAPASPLGDFPELAKFYQSSFQVPAVQAAVGGTSAIDAAQVANAKQAQKDALEQKLQDIQDMQDPGKYQQVAKKDGGYTFLDPKGNEISAFDYSRITGKDPASILANSENPIDQGFIRDWGNLDKFLTAVFNKDTSTVDAIIKQQPELQKYKNNLPGLIQKFHQAYPTVFGQGGFNGAGTAGQPMGRTYIPNAGTVDLAGGGGTVGG